jgi:hypothetical protein
MAGATGGAAHDARLRISAAIGRTEASDEIFRSGACHIGAERSVRLAVDADLAMLAAGLCQLGDLTDAAT